MELNVNHLRYFYFVAKENGYTNASKVLRIQQPAITRMVQNLEEQVGFKLFEKVGRRVQLTPRGLEVFEHCKSIFGKIEDLRSSINQIGGELKGPLIIAAAEPIASYYLPMLLKEFLGKNPKVYPCLYSGPASMLLDRIINGEIEFGIFFHIPDLPLKLEIFHQQDVKFHLVVKKGLQKNKNVLAQFIGSREIDDTSTRRFPTLERLKKDISNASIRISSNNLTAHRELVLQGLGVAILPDFLIRDEIESGELIELYPKEKFIFQMKFIKRNTSILSANAKALLTEK